MTGTANPVSVTMNTNKVITANFIAAGSAELVVNGTFANGTNNWSIGAYNGAQANAQAVNGQYVVTSSSAGSASWNTQVTQTGIRLEQGKTYTLTFEARAVQTRTVEVNIGMAVSPYTSFSGGTTLNLTTTMQRFTKTFIMTAATTTNARLEFNAGLSTPQWYLDNVSLTTAQSFPSPEVSVIKKYNQADKIFSINGISGIDAKNARVQLIDTKGRIIKCSSVQNLSLQNIPTGMYIMLVHAGNKVISRNTVYMP